MKIKSALHKFFRRLYFENCESFLCKLIRSFLKLFVPFYVIIRSCDQRLKINRRKCLSSPVVSIGNLSVGGTGKTAFVLWLLEEVIERGFNPAVLKRGEGDSEGILYETSSFMEGFGDESALLHKNFPDVPLGVGADRFYSGRKIENEFPGVDIFILDDGFQHLQLERQLDVVLFNSAREKTAAQLPAGPLREPISALQRADFISLKSEAQKVSVSWKEFCSRYVDSLPLTHHYQLEGIWEKNENVTDQYLEKPVILLTTLARPQQLVKFLTDRRFEIEDCISLPDHAKIDSTLLERVDLDRLVVTEKELVKLPEDIRRKVGCLRSNLIVDQKDELLSAIEELPEVIGG